MPKLRVDFIFFFFPNISYAHSSSGEGRGDSAVLSAGVMDTADTEELSDHFPVHLTIRQ